MTRVIELSEGRRRLALKRALRNWPDFLREALDAETRFGDLPLPALAFLAQGKEKASFYLYDFIMNIQDLGSGLSFHELHPKQKVLVIDQYLFFLDRLRFECMKRLGWLESYPGEQCTLVDLVLRFHELAPGIQAGIPALHPAHPDYARFRAVNTFDKEALVRKLIPRALQEIALHSSTR
ncbi:MAG: hypothetical protein JRJ29_19010 [Deltaproteobacteria bacterium]|nr:hypothetical protein [Deltaproteobacteria bacterium]